MKNVIFILFLAAGAIFFGCENPAPTQLFQDSPDQGQVKVEVVTKDTGNVFYNNGFDTTGVAQAPTKYTNLITVSGTKISNEDNTTESAFAQALFFDTAHPVRSPHGDTLSFLTLAPGMVMFNNIPAPAVPYRIKYSSNNLQIDSVLGSQYLLIDNGNIFNRLFFKYDSQINFRFVPKHGRPVSFEIPTPPQISGSVKLTGHLSDNNLSAVVQWNKAGSAYQTSVELIIGAIIKEGNGTYPLFKLESKDNGSITVPSRLLNIIPQEKYDKLVFTLVRKIELSNNDGDSRIDVLSQSIHSIILEIP